MYYYIEPMTETDIDQVQAVERRSFDTLWSPHTYRRELRNATTSTYVVARTSQTPPPPQQNPPRVRRNGLLGNLLGSLLGPTVLAAPPPLVGYGGLWVAMDEGHITTIAVDPDHRQRGVGELLLNHLIDQAIALHAAALTLEVRVSNVSAQQLYLKYGFQPAGTRKRYYTDNGEDALIMWTDPLTSSACQARLRALRQQLFARLRAHASPTPAAPPSEEGPPPTTLQNLG